MAGLLAVYRCIDEEENATERAQNKHADTAHLDSIHSGETAINALLIEWLGQTGHFADETGERL